MATTGSTALQNLVQNVYGNSTDLASAKATLGGTGYNYVDTSATGYKPSAYKSNDIVVGGTGSVGGVSDSGSALRLAGADRNATASALSSYASGKNSVQQYVPPTPTVTDNSALISSQYANSLTAAQDALKASIAESKVAYQTTIDKAPGTYQPLRDQASYAGAQNGQNLQEMLANNGQQGGVNRTEETAVNSATEKNINSLNQQQQSVIDTANATIADLQAQGDIKGAELVAQNASDKLSALIAESNRVSAATSAATQQAYENSVTSANLVNSTNSTNASIKSSNADTDLKSAQLKEITDPNSTTNQMAKLGLDTAKLNYAALPAQLKASADTITQQLAKGAIDIKTAQTQLDYLPQQMQSAINQNNASANASNASANQSNASASAIRSGGTSSGGTAKAPTAAQVNATTNANIATATAYVTKMVYTNNNTTAGALDTLQSHKGEILTGLQNAGMSGKDALSYYTQIQTDLTGKK